MIFADLLALPFSRQSNIIDSETLRRLLPNTPDAVIQQVYSDHGRNEEFQRIYAAICLDRLQWSLEAHKAGDLIGASMNPDFENWFTLVGNRVADMVPDDWASVDGRPEVVDHWRQHRTWMISPVMLDGLIIGAGAKFHLVEGHTRLGLLAGLVHQGILQKISEHKVWIGRYSFTD
jgi:hypothetical protein